MARPSAPASRIARPPERADVLGARGQGLVVERGDRRGVAGGGRLERGGGRQTVEHGSLDVVDEHRVARHQHAGADDLRLVAAHAARRAPRAPRPRRASAACARSTSSRAPLAAAPSRARPPRRRARARSRSPGPARPGARAGSARPSARGDEGAAERPDDQRGRGRARVLMTHGALAEVRRAALARLHRRGGARALVRGVGGRRQRVGRARRPRRAARAARPPRGRARRPSSCRPARRPRAPGPPPSAASSAPTSAGPSSSPSPTARPARRSAEPHSGPLAPPTVETSVLPARIRRLPGARLVGVGQRGESPARIPRVMLIPWSPSPIAESSCVRWSASASMAAADPVIQSSTDSTWLTAIGAPTAYAPQRSAAVWTGASHSCASSSSSSSSVSDAPAISSDVMYGPTSERDGLQPGRAQPALDLPVEQVELEQRRAAHPVDERQHLRAARRAEVADDGLDHHVGDLRGGAERLAAPARLAVDADADLDLARGEVEDRLAGRRRRARRQRDAERARRAR